jgi:hypothetical protein
MAGATLDGMQVLLLVMVSLSAAAFGLWLMTTFIRGRQKGAPEEGDRFEFAPIGGPTASPSTFVLQPAPLPDDRPPRPRSVLLIAVAVLLVAALGAGLAWGVGYLINEQLARVLTQ